MCNSPMTTANTHFGNIWKSKMTDKLRVILSVINPRDMGIMRHEVVPLLRGLIQGLVLYTSNPPHPANVKIGKFSEGGSCGDLILH